MARFSALQIPRKENDRTRWVGRVETASRAVHLRAHGTSDERLLGSVGQPDSVMFTIHGSPNLSVHMPNVSPHICFSRGIFMSPPADSLSQ